MLDVIIPTTGKRTDELFNAILSLNQQTIPVNIIIILGTKNQITITQIKSICTLHNCTLLFEPLSSLKGSKRALACNIGLYHSTQEFVAFIDDDVVVPPTWAETSIKHLKFPHIAGVTSGCKSNLSPFHLVQHTGSDSHSKNFNEPTPILSTPGYNSVYRRSSIIKVGPFNEKIGGCEDWELNYRLRKSGFLLLGIPEKPVIHRHNYTLKSFTKQMFGYGWSRSRLLKVTHIFTPKHSFPSLFLISLPFIFLLGNVPLILFFLGLPVAGFILLTTMAEPITKTDFLKTFSLFFVMYSAWSLGYLKGLFD
jgi:cellulose synthase/poly-beta-1,6-N-acetylglucosamine synthase-like glycosyltransferase